MMGLVLSNRTDTTFDIYTQGLTLLASDLSFQQAMGFVEGFAACAQQIMTGQYDPVAQLETVKSVENLSRLLGEQDATT